MAIIVPNTDFISQQVVNWSYGDPKLRLHVPVGLAYGTDAEVARGTLLAVAAAHPHVLQEPAPEVWLTSFGDNTLNFELLAWILDPPRARAITSELNFAILAACNARGLEIAFPQRDLHLRTAVPLRVEMAGRGDGAES